MFQITPQQLTQRIKSGDFPSPEGVRHGYPFWNLTPTLAGEIRKFTTDPVEAMQALIRAEKAEGMRDAKP